MTNTMEWTISEYNQWIKDGQPINLLVTKLDISSRNINSLYGIENLVNLTTLNCGGNQLTSLNGMSCEASLNLFDGQFNNIILW